MFHTRLVKAVKKSRCPPKNRFIYLIYNIIICIIYIIWKTLVPLKAFKTSLRFAALSYVAADSEDHEGTHDFPKVIILDAAPQGSNLLVLALAGGLGYIGVHREDVGGTELANLLG